MKSKRPVWPLVLIVSFGCSRPEQAVVREAGGSNHGEEHCVPSRVQLFSPAMMAMQCAAWNHSNCEQYVSPPIEAVLRVDEGLDRDPRIRLNGSKRNYLRQYWAVERDKKSYLEAHFLCWETVLGLWDDKGEGANFVPPMLSVLADDAGRCSVLVTWELLGDGKVRMIENTPIQETSPIEEQEEEDPAKFDESEFDPY